MEITATIILPPPPVGLIIVENGPKGDKGDPANAEAAEAAISAHAGRVDNPHGVTAAQAGADPAGSAAIALVQAKADATAKANARAPQPQIFEFTTSTAPAGAVGGVGAWTWNFPEWCTFCEVTVIAGGGGGGSGRRGSAGTNRWGGSGGAGGGVSTVIRKVDVAMRILPVTINVGAGGAGGASVTADSTDGFPGSQGALSELKVGNMSASDQATGYLIVRATGGRMGPGGTSIAGGGGAANTYSPNAYGMGLTAIGQPGANGGNQDGGNTGQISSQVGPCGGGGGGGVTSLNVAGSGGFYNSSGVQFWSNVGGPAGRGVAPGGDGRTPASAEFYSQPSYGGAGNHAGPGGSGGNGGEYGGGGGGGGGCINGFPSGAGGNGGSGLVRVICW